MFMSYYQNAEQNLNIKTANELFEMVAKFKYQTKITFIRKLREDYIWRMLDIIAVKIKMYNTIVLLVFCMGVKLGLSPYG
jgi:Na+/alanine symporter